MIKCIIAEKPSVAKDIAKIVSANERKDGYFQGNNYIVTWAFGHLISLAMPDAYGWKEYKLEELPLIPKPFKLVKTDSQTANKQLNIIADCFKKADSIVVATDAGREGELIFRLIYDYLSISKPFERLWISSLTDKAIKQGLENLSDGKKYDNLYKAAKSRAEADWIVGINSSRALSISSKSKAISLGRVQTPTLCMIAKRFIDNRDFKSIPYWKIKAQCKDYIIDVKSIKDYESVELAKKDLARIDRSKDFIVKKADRKASILYAPLLYDLTTLQKEANKKYSFTADKTLQIAQSLYEKKITSYPRTSSRYVSSDIFDEYPSILKSIFDMDDFSEYKSIINIKDLNYNSVDNEKITDHHAIIPTGEISDDLNKDEKLIYDMIVFRFLESIMNNANSETLSAILEQNGVEFSLKASIITKLGWKELSIKNKQNSDSDEEQDEQFTSILPEIYENDGIRLSTFVLQELKTKPKPLFTDASILSAMENASSNIDDKELKKSLSSIGIGTPATRASIIELLIHREYIQRNKKNLIPTQKGLDIYNIVKDLKIASVELSASWEMQLGKIEQGQAQDKDFMSSIIDFSKDIVNEISSTKAIVNKYELLDCPKCKNHTFTLFPKVAKCTNENCDFIIWKNIASKEISNPDIKDLIIKKKTKLIKGFTSKAGKTFDAHLVLDQSLKTAFEFANKKK